ncbi:MAG: hypothetical protein ACFFDN_22665, partial [Candidatus Hodarchaeota archaeon]
MTGDLFVLESPKAYFSFSWYCQYDCVKLESARVCSTGKLLALFPNRKFGALPKNWSSQKYSFLAFKLLGKLPW